MTIPRMTVITLGVASLTRATDFYSRLFSTPPVTQYEGVTFIPLPGVWLSLYPLEKLVEDTGQNVPLPAPGTFRSFTLAYNARSKEEVKLPPAKPEAYWVSTSKALINREQPKRLSFSPSPSGGRLGWGRGCALGIYPR